MGMTFGHIEHLHLLWLVPVLGAVYWYGFARKQRSLERFATANLLAHLIPRVSVGRQKVRAALVLAALALLIVALAAPRWGEKTTEVYRRGVDVMIVLDVSRSMLADDCPPNRLDKAKQNIRDLLEILPGDRVGLVTFAGRAAVSCPLTPNYGWFRIALDEVTTESAPRGGSNLAEAIRLAAEKLGERPGNHKAILLITDGEDQDSDPAFAARYAFEDHQVVTFAIGLGDGTLGRRIPVQTDSGVEFVKDETGSEHYSKMNAAVIDAIAGAGGEGFAVPAGTADIDMAELYRRMVAKLAPEEFEAQEQQQHVERYQWFAAAALLLVVIEIVMTDRKANGKAALAQRWAV